jgi:hypothetical protein
VVAPVRGFIRLEWYEMLQAIAELKDGKKLMILGLTRKNLERLLDGRPIKFDATKLGYPGFISIFVGETEATMTEDLAEFMDSNTKFSVDKSLDEIEDPQDKKPEGDGNG